MSDAFWTRLRKRSSLSARVRIDAWRSSLVSSFFLQATMLATLAPRTNRPWMPAHFHGLLMAEVWL